MYILSIHQLVVVPRAVSGKFHNAQYTNCISLTRVCYARTFLSRVSDDKWLLSNITRYMTGRKHFYGDSLRPSKELKEKYRSFVFKKMKKKN